jgi:hypothetical protein
MSPAGPRINELTDEMNRLQDRYNRHSAQVQRAMKDYDESPDGHPAKARATADMSKFSDMVHADERALTIVIDELESLGAFE